MSESTALGNPPPPPHVLFRLALPAHAMRPVARWALLEFEPFLLCVRICLCVIMSVSGVWLCVCVHGMIGVVFGVRQHVRGVCGVARKAHHATPER